MQKTSANHSVNAGVRPADQIRPAEAFCLARGVVISKQVNYFYVNNTIFCSYLLKCVARRAQIFFETARGRKQLPIPVLKGTLIKLLIINFLNSFYSQGVHDHLSLIILRKYI